MLDVSRGPTRHSLYGFVVTIYMVCLQYDKLCASSLHTPEKSVITATSLERHSRQLLTSGPCWRLVLEEWSTHIRELREVFFKYNACIET